MKPFSSLPANESKIHNSSQHIQNTSMADQNNFNSQHFDPSPPPLSSSPDNDTTVIIVVFVSFGCLLVLACCLFALWCFIMKGIRKRKLVQKTETVNIDEHLKMKEEIVQGPHRPQTVALSMEEDVRIDDEIKKSEVTLGDKNMHAKSEDLTLDALEAGQSSGTSHKLEHK